MRSFATWSSSTAPPPVLATACASVRGRGCQRLLCGLAQFLIKCRSSRTSHKDVRTHSKSRRHCCTLPALLGIEKVRNAIFVPVVNAKRSQMHEILLTAVACGARRWRPPFPPALSRQRVRHSSLLLVVILLVRATVSTLFVRKSIDP